MNLRSLRSCGLLLALACAAAGPFLVNCAAPDEYEEEENDDALTGVNNKLGLGLLYDETTGAVTATLKESLKPGEQLRIRVRRGKPELGDEAKIDCDSITEARPISGPGSRENAPIGKVVYQGPKVAKELVELVTLYDDHRFQSDPAWAARRTAEINAAGGPKALVEACVIRPGKTPIKLQTNLEQAWDLGNAQKKDLGSRSLANGLHFNAGDGGVDNPTPAQEQALHSMEEYGEKCVEELGEIPFFKKLGDGKYDTFDCRDFVGTGDGHDPVRIAGVEGALIPLMQNDQPVTKCDGEGEHGQKPGASYNCVDKCDRAEFLSEGCEPGPTVTHAVNEEGTHWILLCRKVAGGEEIGWTKTKRFNDIAMIGNNPKTGKTCFFQNTINSGTDGEHVPHPADREKSRTIWDSPKGYCFESCHGTDPFIQSPWINGAKRSDGKPVVPMMGIDPDYEISWLEAPYYVVNMDAQHWSIPKQLVSEEAGPCITCHRAGGNAWIREFANWTTGNVNGGGPISQGDSYWNKITDSYKAFEKAHWMPMRLEGITAETWPSSQWQKAIDHLNKCNKNQSDPECVWADVPRGEANPQRPGQL